MNNPDAGAAAAAGGAPPPQQHQQHPPSFVEDPAACLSFIANRPATHNLWHMLGGTAAACIKVEVGPGHANVCALYLQAVAQQLAASENNLEAAAAVVGNNSNNNNAAAMNVRMEAEMVQLQKLYEILEAVAVAATKCSPRLAISQTGILRALLSHPSCKSAYLTQVQVEFCHLALLAEQYRFAARAMEGTWPRPTSAISVRSVLRYYGSRGMIHVGCNDHGMAIRCFWTCLSVPSDIVSVLGLNAWKKLVLVQCLQMEDDDYRPMAPQKETQQRQQQHQQHQVGGAGAGFSMNSMGGGGGNGGSNSSGGSTVAILSKGPLSLPKAIPTCYTRFLNAAGNTNSKQASRMQNLPQQQRMQPEEMQQHPGMVQEDLGEPSSEQQHQHPPQQQGQPSHSNVGVRVYMDLVHAFLAGDRDLFQSLQQQHAAWLESDGNMGLVRQCETAMLQRQVYQLSRMYAVIPLTQLATKLKMESVEKTKELLQQLSILKTCAATSNSKHTKWPSIDVEDDGMVVFHFASTTTVHEEIGSMMTATESDGTDRELEDNIKELIHLTQQVEKLDVNIAVSPMYHALVRRNNDAKMGGPRGVDEM